MRLVVRGVKIASTWRSKENKGELWREREKRTAVGEYTSGGMGSERDTIESNIITFSLQKTFDF